MDKLQCERQKFIVGVCSKQTIIDNLLREGKELAHTHELLIHQQIYCRSYKSIFYTHEQRGSVPGC